MVIPPPPLHSDADRSSSESRALDCNLTAICDHIQLEGFNSGSFSDIVIHSMGSTFYLHRLILSRSSYFRNMLHGPWKEASAQVLTLNVDDNNVNGEAVAMALAYLYGHHPRLNDSNAFRVLAAASFLDLQDLCAICTDFVISELWSSNFLVYQVFAESQDYGIHGERVRNACWGYLCQSGALELKQALPRLSSRTLYALLNSDALWIPSEEKRFELALFTLLAKGALCKTEQHEQENLGPGKEPDSHSDFKNSTSGQLESQSEYINLKDKSDGHGTVHSILKEHADHVVDFDTEVSSVKQLEQCSSLCNSKLGMDVTRSPCSYVAVSLGIGASGPDGGATAMEGPSEEVQCFRLNKNFWFNGDQPNETSTNPPTSSFMPSEWGRFDLPPFTCDGRVVGRRQCSSHARENCGMREDESEAFFNIFEGGSLLYSNMSFEALINVKKQLEDLGFPCKAVNDGLWLQMLLRQRVQEIGVDACKNCWLTNTACPCRQPVGFQHGCTNSGCHFQRHDQNIPHSNMGNIYVTDSNHGEGRPVRVHVRDVDGLAGIGRGATFVTADAWPPTRFVFSRVPFGVNNRINQQSVCNDDTEASTVHNGDLSGDGLTALVGLSQGGRNTQKLFGEQSENRNGTEVQKKLAGASVVGPNTSGIPIQILDSSQENGVGIEWDTTSSSISLDMKTPLVHFPPFRFGVEFEDVHRLTDGQVKHSPEAYYAGSLWKVSVQAFNDEDPQGRRTLGLFLHRRRAEIIDPVRKVHMFVDTREKVIARYKLLCPSKRDVMVLGNFSETGTLLPKAPKGWGWRSALLFNELEDLLQNGALRVAAVVQLV